MNIFGREKFHYLCQHIFQKLESLFITDTEIGLFVRFVCTRQLRISSQYFFRMRRHLYLRNNSNKTFLSVCHQFTDIILSIITSVSIFTTFFFIPSSVIPPFFPCRKLTPCRKFCQTGIFFYFKTPARSVSKMQMQTVQFIICQSIHLLFYKFLIEEMTGNIHHKATISKTGFIRNDSCRQSFFINHLQHSLNSIEQSCPGSCTNKYLIRSYRQNISLGRVYLRQFRHLFQDNIMSLFCYYRFQIHGRSHQIIFQNLLVPLRRIYI